MSVGFHLPLSLSRVHQIEPPAQYSPFRSHTRHLLLNMQFLSLASLAALALAG